MCKLKKGDKVTFEIEGKQVVGYILRKWKVPYTDEYVAKVSEVPNGVWRWQLGTHKIARVA
jgi:hypothetical protein